MPRSATRSRRFAALLGAVLSAALATGLLAVTTSPATAGADRLTAPNGVLYDTCFDHPYSYTFTVMDGYDYSLEISVEAYGPDGISVGSDYQSGIWTDGLGSLMICGSAEMPGRYTLEAEVEACDSNEDCYTEYLPTGHFTMRAPRTRTTLTATPRAPKFNEVVRLHIGTKDERPAGFFPTDGTYVALEVRTKNGWQRAKGTKTYASNGRAVLRYHWDLRIPVTIRATTLRYDGAAASTSRRITVKAR